MNNPQEHLELDEDSMPFEWSLEEETQDDAAKKGEPQ